jgi:predicted MFS family arabinose efflux permease
VVAGFGFSMVHNTVQANATQMAPTARGTATSMFALLLFMGQSSGVLLAAALVGWLGSGWTIALGGIIMMLTGLWFAAALHRRSAQLLAA